MINTTLPIYLASSSPRRKKLLSQINLKFHIINFAYDEIVLPGEKPHTAVTRIAKEKMLKAKEKVEEGIIITADTIVVIDNKILGKPVNEKDAKRILDMLNGRTHIVYTGFSIYNSQKNKTYTGYEKTKVTFRELSDEEIIEYIKSGSPMDKAGAYGIQDDFGAVFVKKINGCYYNVVGLPLPKIYLTLLKAVL